MLTKKIAVIDDEFNIRETIRELLELHGYCVMTASNGKEGIALIYDFKPDLVLCDVMMFDMNGMEVLETLKEDEQFACLPIVFVTAKNDPVMQRFGMNLGADGYITKPFNAEDLIRTIEQKLNRFERIRNELKQKYGLPEHFTRYGFHKFNTPLNGMLGSVDFLLEFEEKISWNERKDLLKQIKINTLRIKRTYTNLLIYKKISAHPQVSK